MTATPLLLESKPVCSQLVTKDDTEDLPANMPDLSQTISAVIVAQNEEATIQRCIRSVLSQSVPVSEVIVVDGNSTDRTPIYAADLAKRYEQVQVVRESRLSAATGPAAARNAGAELASGDLLLFVSGDVTFGSDYVAKLLDLMEDQRLDAAAGLRWNVRNSLVSGLMNVHYALNYRNLSASSNSPAFLSSDAMVIKADVFWNVGGYDSVMPSGEDMDLGYRLRGAGSRMGYDRSATIWHEGRRFRSVADWFQQLKWYGRGAAALARAHSWRLERARTDFHQNVVLPLSLAMTLLLIAIVAGSVLGPVIWPIGAVGVAVLAVRYTRAALRVQQTCASAKAPGQLLPGDILLYPLFRAVRYAALSAFTWQAISSSGDIEAERSARDGGI